ncbi:hypothetical protein [Burkholderia phage BCSR5]|nr:hypothetical protein [Burkholderia phage BCSR5]
MPSNQIKHDVKEGKGTKKSLEKKWNRAEKIGKKGAKDKKNPWPLVQHIYQNMRDSKKASVQAGTRLQLSAALACAGCGLVACDCDPNSTIQPTSTPNDREPAIFVGEADDIAAPGYRGYSGESETDIGGPKELMADTFEGFINSLQFDYDRPDGANFVIVDAPVSQVHQKLIDFGWGMAKRNDKHIMAKGQHSVELQKADGGRTKIIDVA